MTTMHRSLALLALFTAGAGLRAEDPWQGGFKLTAGSLAGSADAYLGQDRAYGVAMWGRYPLGRNASVAFEAGYKFLPTTTHTVGSTYYDDKSDGYFGGATYQHRLGFEGFHLQAGVRLSQWVAARRANYLPGDGTSLLTKYRGDYATTVKPVLGAGYRLNEKYEVELTLSPTQIKNVEGRAKTGTLLELGLLIHL